MVSACDFLRETLDRVGQSPAAAEAWPLVREGGAGQSDDPDVAWAVARLAYAVGHPAARNAADLDEVRAAVDHVRRVAQVKSTRYYRIGSNWVLYEVVAVLGYPDGDRVLLFPVPQRGRYAFDPAVPQVTLDGRAVPWSLFEPPLLSLLAATDTASWDRAGFVPQARAVPGDARLPPDVRCEVRS